MSRTQRKKPSLLTNTLGFLLITVAVLYILFGDIVFLTKSRIEAHLQHLEEHLAQQAAKAGAQMQLTHGGITIEGWMPGQRQARVIDVALQISKGNSSWSFATGKMIIPLELDPHEKTTLLFPDDILFSEKGLLQATFSFDVPTEYHLTHTQIEGANSVTQSFKLGKQLVITPADNTSGSGKITVRYDENPIIELRAHDDAKQFESIYEFNNIAVKAENGQNINVAKLSSRLLEYVQNDLSTAGKYTINLDGIFLNKEDGTPTQNYNVAADIDYTGSSPSVAIPSSNDSSMSINNLLLSNDSFNIHTSGSIENRSDDIMPSGAINLKLTNVHAIIMNEFVPDFSREALAEAIEQITGKAIGDVTDTTIAIHREKNGTLYIGDTTLDDLTSSIFSGLLGGLLQPNIVEPMPSIEPENREYIMPDMPKTPEISN